MKKHHLFLTYIFLAMFSLSTIAAEQQEKKSVFSGLKAKLSGNYKKEKTPQPVLHANAEQQPVQHIQVKQKKLEFLEVFPGVDQSEGVNVEKLGPIGVPYAITDHAVSVCTVQDPSYQNMTLLTYLGKDALVYAVLTKDLKHWTKPTKVFGDEPQTSTYIHCAAFNFQPYVFCGGKLTFSKDGVVWEEPYPLEHAENSLFVTMCQEDNLLVAAHTGKDHFIHLSTSEDARKWKPLRKVCSWQTKMPVCLIPKREMWIGWVPDSETIYTATVVTNFNDHGWDQWSSSTKGNEIKWEAKHAIKMAIGACVYDRSVEIVFLGENNKVYFSYTHNNGMDWSEAKPLKSITTDQPLCIFDHTFYKSDYRKRLFFAYTGLEGQVYIISQNSN